MKNSIKVFYYFLAFVAALAVMYLFLFIKLGNCYLDFKKDTYCLNDILNEVKDENYDIDDYNIYIDNLRTLTDSEKEKFNCCTLKYVPRYRAVGKSLFDDILFFLRAVDDDSELFYFYRTASGTFVELIHWGESVYDVYYAYFEVENLDLSSVINKEIKNSKIKIETYQNTHYDMSNLSILIIWIIIVIVAETTVYQIIKKRCKKKSKHQR